MTWFIVLLALLLRIPFINQSLWLDEAIEALAVSGRMGPLLSYALADFQPPLYHFLVAGWTSLVGYSEIALRTPSLMAGLGTVWFLYKIGKHLGGTRLGNIVGILAATNPLLVYYSQEGRTYALTTFFVTASMYYFIKLIHDQKNSPLTTLCYLLTTIFYLWTSYLAWFILLAQFIYLFYRRKYSQLILPILAGLTLVLWLPSFLESLNIGRSTMASSPAWGRVVGGISLKSVALTWVKFSLGRVSIANKYLYAALTILLGLLHLFILRKVKYSRYSTLLIWLAVPIICGLLVSVFVPVYSYTRIIFVLPAYLLLLALGLSQQPTSLNYIIVGAQLLALAYFWITPSFHREDWRGLVTNLPNNVTLAMPSRAQSAPIRYYGYEQDIIEPSHETLTGKQIYYIRYVEDLFDPSLAGQANFARSGYTITQQYTYPGLQLDIYAK